MITFVFNRLFFIDMLLIGFLLTSKFPKREGLAWRVPLSVFVCLLFSGIWTEIFKEINTDLVPLRMLLSTINYMGAFIAVLSVIRFCVRMKVWNLLYMASMMWFVQQSGNCLDFTINMNLGKSWGGLAFHLFCVLLVAMAAFVLFVRKIDVQILSRMRLQELLPTSLLMCLACLELNSFASDSNQTNTAYYLAVFMLDWMGIIYQHGLYRFSGLERETESIQMLIEQGDKQFNAAKENVEQINIKAHDLKHQIRLFREEGRIDNALFSDIKQVIDEYDTSIHTGNKSLDIILTEKSLVCRNKGIGFTCMAEAKGLDYMEPADMYSLFGNALENAIEASMRLDDPAKRQIAMTVRPTGAFYSINIQNYSSEKLNMENNLPITTKADRKSHGYGVRSMQIVVEKYGGELSLSEEDETVSLYILLPMKK